jgi:hypothetical protein
MAGQSLERREVLRIMAMAAAAAHFPGFAKWSFALGQPSGTLQDIKMAFTLRTCEHTIENFRVSEHKRG